MLGAVAESRAMLVYLDNWLSSDPDGSGTSIPGASGAVEVSKEYPYHGLVVS